MARDMLETIIWGGLSVSAWITIAIVLTMFSLMLFTKLHADIVFLGGMMTLMVTGVLKPEQAVSGFSSTSVVVVGVLFVVVAGLVHTGVLHWIVRYVLGSPNKYWCAIVRLMLPVALLSSILSNTTVVALFIDVVKVWSKKLNISPSRLLIPLSYASGMGGICTLIGTPPNLIISSFYTKETGIELSIFTPTLVGLFCLAVGIVSVIAMQKLLPERKSPEKSFANLSDYTVELMVPSDNDMVGKTVKECGLDSVKGGHLMEIVCFDKAVITPVEEDEFIMGGDRLVFSGRIEELLQLRDSRGLVNAVHHVYSLEEMNQNRTLHTAYVTFRSSLIGEKIAETNFEKENGMTLVAVARKGERLEDMPREVVLDAGDTLLLESTRKSLPANPDIHFYDSDATYQINGKTIVSSLIMLGMLLLSAFKVLPLVSACFLAAFAMLLTKCCTVKQARKSINWEVLMVFAGSVCLGLAIENTGIAQKLANGLLGVCGTNPYVVLFTICIVSTFVTEFVSNTAAGAMFFPIAYNAALAVDANPLTFCVALMVAVSSSFATPIGSPTHMMVYGPGGYRFADFMRIGIPMNFIIVAADVFITVLLFPMHG